MPMNPEIKAQWVAALRSGEYEQGHSLLTSPGNKDCCLGVLCKLAVKAGADVVVRHEEGEPGVPPAVLYDGELSFLPETVAEWAGLVDAFGYTIDNPLVKQEDYTRSLATLNDGVVDDNETIVSEPLTFAEIAELIEADTEL